MKSQSQQGFTLLELMMVVGVIAILAAVSYPSYREYTFRAKRTDGKNALVDLAARQERYRFNNNVYTSSLADLNMTSATAEGHYTVSITSASALAFAAQVAPTATQSSDKCNILSITNTGQKGTTNSNSLSATECWK